MDLAVKGTIAEEKTKLMKRTASDADNRPTAGRTDGPTRALKRVSSEVTNATIAAPTNTDC